MRVRMFTVVAVLAAVTFAGCADVEDEPLDDVAGALFDEAGLVKSHPDFQFLTNAALVEAPEPGRINEVQEDGTIVWYKPAYRGFPDAISGLEPMAQANTNEVQGGGRGIAVFGSLVFAGPNAGPLSVIDISIPEEPKVIGVSEDTPVRDADTILFPDGRLVLITSSGGRNIVATDVTDPTNPHIISDTETPAGNHTIAVVPGSPIAYNTGMDIIDFSDPENPIITGTFEGGDGCHDIAFHIDQEAHKVWALCAGYAQTEIWDIHDPFHPELIVAIDYPSMDKGLPVVGGQLDDLGVPQDIGSPAGQSAAFPLSFSHLAIVNHDASVLIMGDETGGGGINGCDFYQEGPDGTTYSGPIGNLWFYDISDPENPDLRGHVSPANGDADGSCTAHFGKTIEDSNYLAMAFYSAGITLVDFQDLDNPKITDRWDDGGDIWDVQFHQGYLFTGDMTRGVDVLGLS